MEGGGQRLLEVSLFLQACQDLLQLALLGANEVQLTVQPLLLALGSLHLLIQLRDLGSGWWWSGAITTHSISALADLIRQLGLLRWGTGNGARPTPTQPNTSVDRSLNHTPSGVLVENLFHSHCYICE